MIFFGKSRQAILAAILALFACQDDNCNPSGPSPTPPNTTTSAPPAKPPRVDIPPAIDDLKIYSAFALALRDEATIRAIVADAMSKGWNTCRVCGEVEGWPGMASMALGSPLLASYLPKGPRVDTPAALENVHRILDVTARIPGASVLLVPVCTMKENGRTFAEIKDWTRKVGDLAGEYEHVIIEAVNEHWHPRSSLRADTTVLELIKLLQDRSGHQVGTDDNYHRGHLDYNPALRPHVDFLSAHPWRNPDPNRQDIQRMVDKAGGQLVLSETTSYVTPEQMDLYFPNGSGLVTSNKKQIKTYGRRCKRTPGCVFTFHSVDGLKCEGPFAWMPEYRAM